MANFGQRESKPAGRGKEAARLVQPKRLAADAGSRGHLPDEQPVFHEGSIGLPPWGNVKDLRGARDVPEGPDVSRHSRLHG
jgi:hypothetical protein